MAWEPNDAMAGRMAAISLGQMPGQSAYMPSFSQQQYGAFGTPYPMSEDELEYNNDQATYVNKLLEMQFSPEVAMLTGGTGIPQEFFEPQVSYETVARPGYDMLKRQIRQEPMMDPNTGQPIIDPNTGQPVMGPSPVQTYHGFVADKILNGGSAGEAMAQIRQIVTNGEQQYSMNPEDENYNEAYAMLRNSMPTMYTELATPGQPPQIDWMTAQNDALSWEQQYVEDPKPGPAGSVYDEEGNMISGGEGVLELQYDDQGNQVLVKRTEEPTDIMEMYAEYGLPSPYDKYEAKDFLGPDWEAGQQAYLQATSPEAAYGPGGEPMNQAAMRAAMEKQEKQLSRREAGLNRAESDYATAYQDWREGTEFGQLWAEEQAARVKAGHEGISYGPLERTQVGLTRVGGGGIGPGFAVPTVANTQGGLPQSYARPGSTLAEFLRPGEEALEEGGGMPEYLKEKSRKLEARKKRVGGFRTQYETNEEAMQNYLADIEGSRNELFGADYGHALATQVLTGLNQQTPYTDSLIARRMVPLAAGVQTAAYVPTSQSSPIAQPWLNPMG